MHNAETRRTTADGFKTAISNNTDATAETLARNNGMVSSTAISS
jgi:hypothetical protein